MGSSGSCFKPHPAGDAWEKSFHNSGLRTFADEDQLTRSKIKDRPTGEEQLPIAPGEGQTEPYSRAQALSWTGHSHEDKQATGPSGRDAWDGKGVSGDETHSG